MLCVLVVKVRVCLSKSESSELLRAALVYTVPAPHECRLIMFGSMNERVAQRDERLLIERM